MPEVDPGFSVKKPVSVWNRPLKADGKGIFKSLGKAVLHGATAQWTSLGADAVEGLSAVGVSGKATEERAWLLLRRALLVAMEELAEETRRPQEILQKAELAALSDRLDLVLGEAEVELDRSFFERPAALPFLADLQAPFAEWLQGIRLPAPAARSTALRLPSYFALALHTEWSRRSAEYGPIRAKI